MQEIDGVIRFIGLAGRLKETPRSGWLRKVRVKKPESVADHTFGTSMLCMILGDMKGLDTPRMLKMALIHDLCESMTGDLTHYGMSGRQELQKRRMEEDAMTKILSLLPKAIKKRYYGLWKEFQDGASLEARLVRDLDKLDMALQALRYEEEGYDKNKLSEFWDSVETSITNPEVRLFLNSVKEQRR
ncbi:MAG: HD domain-containing protein [Nitrososphaerales archaeon]|nr:HD domain-containing protein [Nitrososphaerales archaeon]